MRIHAIVLTFFFCVPVLAFAQDDATVVTTGLIAPQGIEMDHQGHLWLAEQGTGNSDSRLSVVTSDGQVHAVLEGMPSNIVQGSPEGVHHLLLDGSTLWATQGLGEESPEGNLLRIDVSAFTPGDPPLSMNDVVIEDLGTFVLSHDFSDDTDQTNIYNLTRGPDDHLYIVDASANAVIRRDVQGTLSVFSELPTTANPTSVGPPRIQAVPTGIVFAEGRFLVSAFSGFPFPPGHARIYSIDLAGQATVFQDGLTSAVDLAADPQGNLVALQFGQFDNGFLPNTGSVVRVTEDGVETLLDGLNFPAGLCFAPNGDLYVSTFADGEVLRFDAAAIGTDTEAANAVPDAFRLRPNYPNPFNPATTLAFDLPQAELVTLRIYNALGQQVRTLVEGVRASGHHAVVWDGTDAAGKRVPSGVYLYRLQADAQTASRVMLLMK